MTEYECSPEEFWQLQVEFWSKFYACCLQYQEALSRPLALLLNPYTSMVCLLKKVRLRPGALGRGFLAACGSGQLTDGLSPFQGLLSFLVPCPLVDHLYRLSNEHLLTEDDAAIFDGE